MILHFKLITLHGVRSKSPQKADIVIPVEAEKMIVIQAEMAESETIQTAVTQVSIQAAMAVVMVMKEADAGPASGANTISSGEADRYRCGSPALGQLSFNWNAQDKYTELLSFKMDVMHILQTKTDKLNEEEKVPIIRNWLGREGLQ